MKDAVSTEMGAYVEAVQANIAAPSSDADQCALPVESRAYLDAVRSKIQAIVDQMLATEQVLAPVMDAPAEQAICSTDAPVQSRFANAINVLRSFASFERPLIDVLDHMDPQKSPLRMDDGSTPVIIARYVTDICKRHLGLGEVSLRDAGYSG